MTQFVSARYAAHPGEIEHVTRVAGATMNPTDWTVAMLHDLVEDGFATVDEIERLVGETTLGDSAEVKLSRPRTANAPRRPIRRLHRANPAAGNRAAITVKMLDLFDHLSPYTRASLPGRRSSGMSLRSAGWRMSGWNRNLVAPLWRKAPRPTCRETHHGANSTVILSERSSPAKPPR